MKANKLNNDGDMMQKQLSHHHHLLHTQPIRLPIPFHYPLHPHILLL